MTERSRHGLHVVPDSPPPVDDPATEPPPSRRPTLFLGVHQQSVTLAIAGTLNADTAGRLRMFLTMFTFDDGPPELVLDLVNVSSLDEPGMAPILEADEAMSARMGRLRVSAMSPAVACFLRDARLDRMLAADRLPEPDGAPAAAHALDADGPRRGKD